MCATPPCRARRVVTQSRAPALPSNRWQRCPLWPLLHRRTFHVEAHNGVPALHARCAPPIHARGVWSGALIAPRPGHRRHLWHGSLCALRRSVRLRSVHMPLRLAVVVVRVRLVHRGRARCMRRSERLDKLRLDKTLGECLGLLVVGTGISVFGGRAPLGALLDTRLVRRRRVGRTQPDACGQRASRAAGRRRPGRWPGRRRRRPGRRWSERRVELAVPGKEIEAHMRQMRGR
jgi:hypothetical protein